MGWLGINLEEGLKITGLSLNVFGSIVLALRLRGYLSTMKLMLDAHEIALMSIGNRVEYRITGTDQHVERAACWSKIWTIVGVLSVIGGFVLQIFAVL